MSRRVPVKKSNHVSRFVDAVRGRAETRMLVLARLSAEKKARGD